MTSTRTHWATVLALTAILPASVGVGGCSSAARHGSVTVLATWTGGEADDFKKALDRFERDKHIHVNYVGTRDVDQVLLTDVRNGTPPDIAILPNPGGLAAYRDKLKPLDDVLKEQKNAYSQSWQRLQRLGKEREPLVAVPVKADLKSIVWYPTRLGYQTQPKTVQSPVDLTRRMVRAGVRQPWCLGMSSPPLSGWPGTDWIEDILLHQQGSDAYGQWASGELPWTSLKVQQAWETWHDIISGRGLVKDKSVAASALLTNFADAGRPMFAKSPGCSMEHQASFIMKFYRDPKRQNGRTLRPGTNFDFFPFSDLREQPGPGQPARPALEVSADLAVMFNDTSQARDLMRYLASPQGGVSGAFSANKRVAPDSNDSVSMSIHKMLTSDENTLCFDASDFMPATMSTGFNQAVREYLANPAPTRLGELLTDLDQIRKDLKKATVGENSQDWLANPCG
ncbi:MAG TPA: ABC transporter substrate-binding protein [Mycobacteriales bacterium]|nr:ABC transporter substrate-binding protein [Mycobacteriales bacterium]